MEITMELAYALAMAILHSLWIGLAIGLFLLACLIILKKSPAKVKYIFAYVSMVIMFALFIGSFVQYYDHPNVENSNSKNMVYEAPITNQQTLTSQEITTSKYTINKVNIDTFGFSLPENSRYANTISLVWIFGVFFLIVKILSEYWLAQRLRKHSTNKYTNRLNEKANRLKQKIGLKKELKVFLSSKILSPITMGFLRPAVIIPSSLLSGLTHEQMEAILLHELAHIKRHDYLLNIFQRVIEIFLFYHPVTWVLSSYISGQREKCCDDMVVKNSKDPIEYAYALTFIQKQKFITKTNLTMALSGHKKHLLSRIKRLIENPTPKRLHKANFGVITIIGIIMLSLFVSAGDVSTGNSNYALKAYFNDDTSRNIVQKLTKRKFIDTIDNEHKEFYVELKNDTISALYIDNEKVAEEDLEKYEKIVEKHVGYAEKNECQENAVKVRCREKKLTENQVRKMQEQMTKTSLEISKKMKEVDFEEMFDEDFEEAVIQFSEEMAKMGANIGKAVAESFDEVEMDSIEIHIDKEEIRRDIREALEEIKKLNTEKQTADTLHQAQKREMEAIKKRMVELKKELEELKEEMK